jgi:Ca2+:H+ antiporter
MEPPSSSSILRAAASHLSIQNVLLLTVPAAWACGLTGWNGVLTAVLNLLAIIPLSGYVSTASDKLADRLGTGAGELINATFGNVVELSVGILAINRGEVNSMCLPCFDCA